MAIKTKDSTATLKVVCAILFIIFIIEYVYSFQGDLLAMIQNAWAKGQTHYHRGIGAAINTMILVFIAFLVSLFTRLPQHFSSLIYFPSFLILGLLTAVSVEGCDVTTSPVWLVLSPLLLILYAFIVLQLNKYNTLFAALRDSTFLSLPWWTNIMIMVCMMSLTYSMGNTDRTLHTRLKVERFCHEKLWDKALETGFPQYDNDSSLTMLRALALANKGELGSKLFNYEITGEGFSLTPKPDRSVAFLLGSDKILWQTIGIVPRDKTESTAEYIKRELRRGTVNTVAKDYLLCYYLLNRNLNDFAKTLSFYYNIDKTLPKHYAEAYILYCDKYNLNDTAITQAMHTDYKDFLSVMRAEKEPRLRDATIRKAYFGTYWYYYYKRRD